MKKTKLFLVIFMSLAGAAAKADIKPRPAIDALPGPAVPHCWDGYTDFTYAKFVRTIVTIDASRLSMPALLQTLSSLRDTERPQVLLGQFPEVDLQEQKLHVYFTLEPGMAGEKFEDRVKRAYTLLEQFAQLEGVTDIQCYSPLRHGAVTGSN